MARSLRRLWFSLALALPLAAWADFTEHEDQPFLTPGNAEENTLTTPEPVPEGGANFLTAFPTGIKLVRGNLDANDRDAYAVQLSNGQVLLAALFDQSGGAFLDTALGVFTGTTPPPAAFDDDGSRGFLSRVFYSATTTGLKRIEVTGFGDTAWNGTHKEAIGGLRPYSLLLGAVELPPALHESGTNDTLQNADPLPKNGALLGATLDVHDVDYYAIDLEQGDRLFVAVFDLMPGTFQPALGSFADPIVRLFGPQGTPVAGGLDDDGEEGFAPGLTYTVPTGAGGTYRFAVSGFGDANFDGSHEEKPFNYLVAVGRERACPNVVPLISNITSSSGRPNAIANLQGGAHYYTDRMGVQRHVLVDVPEELECGQWIKTANDDKVVSAFPHLTFTLAQDASVFIGWDTRPGLVEAPWLSSFTPLPGPLLIDIRDSDETQEFRVLRRDFKAGTVQLGGANTASFSNYTVVALPVDKTDPLHAVQIQAPVQTGTAVVTVNGVTISVATSSGQSPATVANLLAAAVNANPTLQSQRIFAIGSGNYLVTTGVLSFPVPLASPWALAALALFLLMGARLYVRAAR